MRKVVVPLLTIAVGVLIGFLIVAPGAPEPVQTAAPGTGFAAIPGEKGGQELFGAYEPAWGVAGPEFPAGFWGVHQASVDQEGNFYTAEVNAGRFQKYRPKPGANPAKVIQPVLAGPATDTR